MKQIEINKSENKNIIFSKSLESKLENYNELRINEHKILDYISLVKILSSFLVILKHTNRHYLVFSDYWVSTNIMCAICMCAVPLFSLSIGATLLNFNKRYGIYEYWKRRVNKLIIPIIGWNIIYYYYRVYVLKHFKKQNLNFSIILKIYFKGQLCPLISSLRIFLFGYMAIPLIAYVDISNKNKIYSYCFIILLINTSIIPYFINTFNIETIIWPYNYNLGYIIYLFAGYIIQNNHFNKTIKMLIYVFGIIGLLSRLFISHYLTLKYKKPDITQIRYQNLPIIIYACSVFLFVKENCIFLFKIISKKYLNILGAMTMGPFFLHFAIIWTFFKFFKYNEDNFTYRFFGAFVITIICFVITFIMKKLPIIKILVP